jgi:hypothetical protein
MTIDKVKKLMVGCKCGVYISVNEHKDYYESAKQYIAKAIENIYYPEDTDQITKDKMESMDSIVKIQFYPETPVGFYNVWSYSLDDALDSAISILESRGYKDAN